MSSSPTRGTTLKPIPGTYTAVEVSAPGELRVVERRVAEPGPGQVRIRVEACGVCHSDSATVEGLFPIDWPRVPGHEAVGRIDALGPGVQGWAVGQRVGVGFLGGSCGYCEFCRNGDLVNCRNQEFTGVHSDGGYAEVMIAKATGLMRIPDDLASAGAAPLLCAGLTTFSALRNAPAKAGELVAVRAIGGLWALRGDKVILITASGAKTLAAAFKGLRPGGISIDLGVGPEPIEITSMDLIFGERKVAGSLTGNPATGDATLRFSALTGVSAMLETVSLGQAAEAYARMMEGKARFRIVLVTKDGISRQS